MYPQPVIVRNLGLKIITKGFNQSEANHEGVSVEEIPCSERAAHSRSDGSPYEPYGDYNIRQCDHKYLVKCFSQLHDIMYATLSHSHLLLVLLSWLNGAEWKIDDEPNLSKLLNSDSNYVLQCRSGGLRRRSGQSPERWLADGGLELEDVGRGADRSQSGLEWGRSRGCSDAVK